MKQLKTTDLKILLDVATTQSFSLTAKNIGLTQASISKSIAAVEAALGMKIIERESRPVGLTPFGEMMLPQIKEYIEHNDAFFLQVENYKKTPAGEVNLYCPSGIQAYLADTVLPPLLQRFPELNVTLTTSNLDKAEYFNGGFFNSACDILISYTRPHNQNLVARKVKRLRMDVFATREFYEQHPFTTPEELSAAPFILLNAMENTRYRNVFDLTDEGNGVTQAITVTGKLSFDNIYTAINCCRRHMGYLVASPLLLQDVSDIQPILPATWGIYIDCYVIFRSRENLPYRVQSALDYIIDLMGESISQIP